MVSASDPPNLYMTQTPPAKIPASIHYFLLMFPKVSLTAAGTIFDSIDFDLSSSRCLFYHLFMFLRVLVLPESAPSDT